jgi:DNA repair exonuclease SbcCD ATPase subunit
MEIEYRMSQMEEETRRNGNAARFLPTASIVVAAFSFMLTTVVWRLVHQTSAVEAAVQESIDGINRFSAANSDELSRLHEGIARQSDAAVALEARLARVESTGVASLERVQSLRADMAGQWAAADQVRQELSRATTAISQTRQEIMERLAVHADRNAAARDAMIRQVNEAITQMERTLLAQATDFQQQKQQFDAAAERDRATRRAMLNEATQVFAVQVEGLRQILDGLQVEAGEVGGTLTPDASKAAAESTIGGAGDAAKPNKGGEPATAALDKEGVLE